MCKQLCQSLDGNISVKSAIGKGSIFSFTMKVKGNDSSVDSGSESEAFIDPTNGREDRHNEAYKHVDGDQVNDINESQFENVLDADF